MLFSIFVVKGNTFLYRVTINFVVKLCTPVISSLLANFNFRLCDDFRSTRYLNALTSVGTHGQSRRPMTTAGNSVSMRETAFPDSLVH